MRPAGTAAARPGCRMPASASTPSTRRGPGRTMMALASTAQTGTPGNRPATVSAWAAAPARLKPHGATTTTSGRTAAIWSQLVCTERPPGNAAARRPGTDPGSGLPPVTARQGHWHPACTGPCRLQSAHGHKRRSRPGSSPRCPARRRPPSFPGAHRQARHTRTSRRVRARCPVSAALITCLQRLRGSLGFRLRRSRLPRIDDRSEDPTACSGYGRWSPGGIVT